MEGQWVDHASGLILNESGVPNGDVLRAMNSSPELAAIARWGQATQRSGGIFERDKYITPESPFDQMRVAYDAAYTDDVVSGILEMAESMTFGELDFDADEEDDENILRQIADDIDLADNLRAIWRELFIVSQAYVAVWWGRKSYKVRGKSPDGRRRKRIYSNLRVPVGMMILDPLKVVPVGDMTFGREKLAYIASRDEASNIEEVLAGANKSDLLVNRLVTGRYVPSEAEKSLLSGLDIPSDNLFLLDSDYVWRITETRPTYQRFANVRMKSIFEVLDLKRQLREMDRAHLIGGTNFIVLVKKGTDDLPAKPAEVRELAHMVRSSARIPLIVGDHRLSVEIVTPKQDNTLQPERYNGLDARITARLFGMFMTGNFAAGAKGDDSIKLARIVARGLETRRDRLVDSFNSKLIDEILDRNADAFASDEASMEFHPERIALDFDPAMATMIQDLRDRGDLSREYTLDQLGADQSREAKRRQREKDKGYDKIFTPVQVPFDSPSKLNGQNDDPNPQDEMDPKTAGRRLGGNRNGGGSNPDSTQPNSSPARPRGGAS